MNGFEIASILGALAWLPPIINLFKTIFSRPKIELITNSEPEIGFSTFGSILNLRLAISVENEDIVISDLKIILQHESGLEKIFTWQGIIQNLGQMNDANLNYINYQKEHSVLALKINVENIEERFIRFQDIQFINKKQKFITNLNKKIDFLDQKNEVEENLIRNLEEFRDLVTFNEQEFDWKVGNYTLSIEMSSRKKFTLKNNRYSFYLTGTDIKKLDRNKNELESFYINEFINKGILNKSDQYQINFEWISPSLNSIK